MTQLFNRILLILACVGLSSGLAHEAKAAAVEATRLSLPKGPGSIEGLGRKFEASPASGTASYGVDIAVPPGIAGFAPQLSLSYDGGSGTSEVGMGWSLAGVPRLRRGTDEGLPLFDDSDRFELVGFGGTSDLVEVATNAFRIKDETGAFVRVKRSSDGDIWEVRSKNGTTYRFGGEGYVEAEDDNVATYLLASQSDLHGHTISYEWDTSGGWAKLTKVTWNAQTDSSKLEMKLSYESRDDVALRFSAGIRQELGERLKTIEVRRGGKLVRRYTLNYVADPHSRLSEVVMVGSDGETAMPTLSFEYTAMRFDSSSVTTMTNPPGRSPEDGNVALSDLNGDGLPDLLVTQAGQYRSYLNHDGTSWQSAVDWATSDSPSAALGTAGVQLADLDGNGAIDLVVKSGTSSLRYFSGKDATSFEPAVAVTTVPNITFEDRDVRLADLDGDRRTDWISTTASGIFVGYNLSGRDWSEAKSVGIVDANQALRFSDGNTSLCDINGDRIQDFCYLRSGSLVYWLGRGRGVFEAASEASGVPTFEDTDPWKLVDLDGDGWLDLVHVGVSSVSFALAEGLGRFGATKTVDGTPTQLSTGHVDFVDMNGSGTTDILWVDVTGSSTESWRYLELFPEGRAGLLSTIDNGLGRITRIEYAPSASFAAAARDAGTPWSTRMNQAMPVVSRIEVDSSLDDPLLVSTIEYAEGTWDPKERNFAGFGSSVQRALGDESTPTLVTTSSYDTGLLHRVLRGLPTEVTQSDESGFIFTQTSTTYQTRALMDSLDGTPVEYGFKSAESTRIVEGTDLSLGRTTATEWEYDDYGSVTRESKWGDIELDGDEVVTVRTYANNEEDWILGYLATEEVLDTAGNRAAMRRHYYDGEAFVGLELGKVTRGDLRRSDSWIEGDTFVDEARYEHDKNGNVVTAIDPRGSRSSMSYDESGQFLTRERRYVDDSNFLEWNAEYDETISVLTGLEEPNGNETRVTYDALGRVTAIVKPGDSAALPTVAYSYAASSPLSKVTTRTRERSGDEGTVDKVTLVDGLGRSRATFVEGRDSGTWIMTGFGRLDTRGNVAFSGYADERNEIELPSTLEQLTGDANTRDALGRNLVVLHADGSTARTEYAAGGLSQWDEDDTDESSPHYGTPTTTAYDGLGRLTSVIEREGAQEIGAAEYQYDTLGKLLAITDALGRTRKYAYDGRSRRVKVDDPNAGIWMFAYSTGNDLVSRSGPDGSVLSYEYDGLGRVTEQRERVGDEAARVAVRYHYDSDADDHVGLANVKGQLAWVEDDAGRAYFGYDGRGRVTDRIRRWSDGKEHHDWTDYDAQDRPIRRGFPNKTHLSVTYDLRGMLASLGPLVPDVRWAPHGGMTSAEFGNGVTDALSYDNRQRLVRMTAEDNGGALLRGFTLQFDAASQITGITDLRSNLTEEETLDATFVYDDRYRVIEANYGAGDVRWELDALSKILSVSSTFDEVHLNIENRYGEDGAMPDQLTSHGAERLTYDAAGRVIKDGERTMTYDANGRLSRVVRGLVVEEYVYAHDGARAIKTTTREGKAEVTRYIAQDVEERDGRIVRYAYIGEQRVVRLDAADVGKRSAPVTSTIGSIATPGGIAHLVVPWRYLGAVLASSIVVACSLLLRRIGRRARLEIRRTALLALAVGAVVVFACGPDGGKQSLSELVRAQSKEITDVPSSAEFYLSDAQLSPLVVVDSEGNAKSRSLYHAYGQVRYQTSEHTDPFGYVGNEEDRGSGLSDFHARPYRPELGIFLAMDPVGLFESESTIGKPGKGEGYSYAEGNPINMVDRDGRCGTPYAVPGTGCERVLKIGPQLPPDAQKAMDAGVMKGTLLALEVWSYATALGEVASVARMLANPVSRAALVQGAKLGYKEFAKRVAAWVAKKDVPKSADAAVTTAARQLPKVTVSDDGIAIWAKVAGDPKAFARVVKEPGALHVTDVFNGAQGAGTGAHILEPALRAGGLQSGQKLVFKNIINPETLAVFESGGAAAESLLGRLGAKTLRQMGLEASSFEFKVVRGKLDLIIGLK